MPVNRRWQRVAIVCLTRGLEDAFTEASCTVWLVDRLGQL
jgi:hypothetical protein